MPATRGPRRRLIRERLDAVDVDNLNELLGSGPYRLIQARIEKVIAEAIEELVRPTNEVVTATVRGKIEGLRLALDIPAILKQEADKGGEEP